MRQPTIIAHNITTNEVTRSSLALDKDIIDHYLVHLKLKRNIIYE